jgi:hypothetical protein
MTKFIPKDEKQLEILFASLEKETGFEYLGCCLDENENRMSSPDAHYYDIKTKERITCEFKKEISSLTQFEKNGYFDMAIAFKWAVKDVEKRRIIEEGLKNDHHTTRAIFILSELPNIYFEEYKHENIKRKDKFDHEQRLDFLLNRTKHLATIYAAFILAKHQDFSFSRKDLTEKLKILFLMLKDIPGQAIQNVLQALYPGNSQDPNPVLSKKMGNTTYCQWNQNYDSATSLRIISRIYQDRQPMENKPGIVIPDLPNEVNLKEYNQIRHPRF